MKMRQKRQVNKGEMFNEISYAPLQNKERERAYTRKRLRERAWIEI